MSNDALRKSVKSAASNIFQTALINHKQSLRDFADLVNYVANLSCRLRVFLRVFHGESAVCPLEFFHKFDKCYDAVAREGVINRGAQAADAAMAF